MFQVTILTGNETGNFKCILCEKYFDKEKDVALHRFYFHKEPPFVCLLDNCNCTFWKKSALVMHQVTAHKKHRYCCKICKETFSGIVEKQHHMKSHHLERVSSDKLFSCARCEKRFCSKATLKMHTVVHSDVRKFKCHLCDKSFKLKLTLSRHLQFHKKNGKKQTEMNESTASETEIKIDNFIICNNEPQLVEEEVCSEMFKICTMFKCSDCNLLFTHRNLLESHIAEVHNNKEELVNCELSDIVELTMERGGELI